MSWARLDDRWHDHPKTIEVGLEGAGLWVMCLTWAHQAQRTSPTPGVIPDAVIARFAGPKAKRLARVLHQAGYLDDHLPTGWPIHDFADYLPKYDVEQAREAGRKGGKTTQSRRPEASEPLSEPLDGWPSEPPDEPSSETEAEW